MSDRYILIGHPVAQSVSPAIHHAAYDLLDYEAKYELCDCPDESAVLQQVGLIRAGSIKGANVTVPWKKVAFDAADVHDDSALRVGVANVLARDESGRVVAYNTDAIGLAHELKGGIANLKRAGDSTALIIGAGGATQASVVACQMAGVSEVIVTARRFDPGREEHTWPSATAFKELGATLAPWPTFDDGAALKALAPRVSLLVQATSAGMKGKDGGQALCALLPWAQLKRAVAYDLVYNPPVTPFLKRATDEGHLALGGLGMLVGQAAHALRIWTGQLPPLPPLHSAAQKALGL